MSFNLRVATFNLENLDSGPNLEPSLDTRIEVLRPQLERLRADILCLQEIHSQKDPSGKRNLSALQKLIQNTLYADYELIFTKKPEEEEPYSQRNLVVLSRFPVLGVWQYIHDLTPAPEYRPVTAQPPIAEAKKITWERPIQHVTVKLPDESNLDVINLHLKSKNPTSIPGQQENFYTWKSASGWAEGFFLSSVRRVGQALETRVLVDTLFDQDPGARIIVAGDYNADSDEVPVEAILGRPENTGNGELSYRELIPCEKTIPETARYTLYHHGRKNMLDHLVMSKSLLPFYRGSEIHNENLPDESIAFATDTKFPQSDHAPVVADFQVST
jgi:endonuclease/exonuclease/phosphatase family metal-dependent hydrolase